MIVAVSPHHLSTREPPAMAALLLASRVVTLLPAPFESVGAAAARERAERLPGYRAFVKSWSWTQPLWDSGVLVSDISGDTPREDARVIARRIGEDEFFASLRPLMHEGLFEDENAYLQAVGSDVTRGGPDPSITVPLAAGLDRFAIRHGLVVARAKPVSVAQRAEAQLGSPAFSVAIPVLLQASGERLMHAREALKQPLDALRLAFEHAARAVRGGNGALSGAVRELARAAADYAAAFEADAPRILEGSREDDVRPVVGTVVVRGVALPYDAVLRSSLAAVDLVAGVRARAGAGESTALTHAAAGDAGSVVALVVNPMGDSRHR